MLFPITKAICELLDPQQRETKCNELIYDDFEKMHPDDVARFCEWLTEKVDGYSSKIKLEAKDLEEEVPPSLCVLLCIPCHPLCLHDQRT